MIETAGPGVEPTTSKLALGVLVPIPTKSVFLPITTELSFKTTEPEPIAVLYLAFAVPAFAPQPTSVLYDPVVIDSPVSFPIRVLHSPVVTLTPELSPKVEFPEPVVNTFNEFAPTPVLSFASPTIAFKTLYPTAVLLLPSGLYCKV